MNYNVVRDRDRVSFINLRDLFTKPYEEQPWLVDEVNCIYLITNLIDNKVYVGQTTYLYGRFVSNASDYSHLNRLSTGGTLLYNSIRKYKSRNFKVEVLESNLSLEDLDDREIYYIRLFDSYRTNGYNLSEGGKSSSSPYID